MKTAITNKNSLRYLLHFLFKRKLQIITIFFITVSISIIVALLLKPFYEAQAQILVKIGRESVYTPATVNLDPVVNYDRREQINSEIEILKSRTLAEKTLAAVGIDIFEKSDNQGTKNFLNKIPLSDEKTKKYQSKASKSIKNTRDTTRTKNQNYKKALANFQTGLKVEAVPHSNLISVTFRHADPDRSAEIVNELSSIYLDYHLQVHKPQQSNNFFKTQLNYQKQKMKQTEKKLEKLKKDHDITSFDEQRKILLRQTAEKRVEVDQTLSEEAEVKNKILELKRQLGTTSETITQEKVVDHNPYLISNLQARLVELELEEKQLLTKYKESSRLVRNIREEIRLVNEKLSENEAKQYGRTHSGMNPMYQRLKEELFKNEANLKSLSARRQTLNLQLNDYQSHLGKLNQIEAYHNQIQQELEVVRENYRLYLTKFEESRISDAMDTEKIANVSLVEAAQPPIKPVPLPRRVIVLIGLFLGIFGGIGFAIFTEYLDDTLEQPEDVEAYLEIPVLTSIPEFASKNRQKT
jgi:uncharacterized protein involved in exopolysaccharide biosynthesis